MCDSDDCCKRLSKFLLVVINLFFLLLGLLMLAFGIAMVAAPDKVAASVKETGADLSVLGNANYIIKAAGIFMIVLGGVVALIGAFGFFGACCENRVLLVLYLIVVIIVLLAEVALIIFAACYPENLREYIQKEMKQTLIKNFTQDVRVYPNITIGSDYPFGYSWAATQLGAKCCGVYNTSDYTDYSAYGAGERMVQLPDGSTVEAKVPISCCKLNEGVKFPDGIKSQNDFVNLGQCLRSGADAYVNTENCYNRIDGMIKQASRIAIGIAAAIVGFQVIIIVVGFCLCCQLRKYQKSAAI